MTVCRASHIDIVKASRLTFGLERNTSEDDGTGNGRTENACWAESGTGTLGGRNWGVGSVTGTVGGWLGVSSS